MDIKMYNHILKHGMRSWLLEKKNFFFLSYAYLKLLVSTLLEQ